MRNQHSKTKTAATLIFIAVLLIIGAIGLGIYLALNPPDRIKVSTSLLPPGTIFISFVCESNSVLQNMDWYPKSEIGVPFTMRPSESVWSSLELNKKTKVDWDAYVQWRWGEQYGVVTRNKGGSWQVTWFAANDVSIKGHWIILGNGKANFDMSKGTTKLLTQEQIIKLRLHEFRFLGK